jgi:hypothetical protein
MTESSTSTAALTRATARLIFSPTRVMRSVARSHPVAARADGAAARADDVAAPSDAARAPLDAARAPLDPAAARSVLPAARAHPLAAPTHLPGARSHPVTAASDDAGAPSHFLSADDHLFGARSLLLVAPCTDPVTRSATRVAPGITVTRRAFPLVHRSIPAVASSPLGGAAAFVFTNKAERCCAWSVIFGAPAHERCRPSNETTDNGPQENRQPWTATGDRRDQARCPARAAGSRETHPHSHGPCRRSEPAAKCPRWPASRGSPPGPAYPAGPPTPKPLPAAPTPLLHLVMIRLHPVLHRRRMQIRRSSAPCASPMKTGWYPRPARPASSPTGDASPPSAAVARLLTCTRRL